MKVSNFKLKKKCKGKLQTHLFQGGIIVGDQPVEVPTVPAFKLKFPQFEAHPGTHPEIEFIDGRPVHRTVDIDQVEKFAIVMYNIRSVNISQQVRPENFTQLEPYLYIYRQIDGLNRGLAIGEIDQVDIRIGTGEHQFRNNGVVEKSTDFILKQDAKAKSRHRVKVGVKSLSVIFEVNEVDACLDAKSVWSLLGRCIDNDTGQ